MDMKLLFRGLEKRIVFKFLCDLATKVNENITESTLSSSFCKVLEYLGLVFCRKRHLLNRRKSHETSIPFYYGYKVIQYFFKQLYAIIKGKHVSWLRYLHYSFSARGTHFYMTLIQISTIEIQLYVNIFTSGIEKYHHMLLVDWKGNPIYDTFIQYIFSE